MTTDEWKEKLLMLVDKSIAIAKKRDAAGSDEECNELNSLLEQHAKEILEWIPKVYEVKQ